MSGNLSIISFSGSWSASMLREGSYSTIRLGAYEPLKSKLGATDPAHTPLWKKILAGATSGMPLQFITLFTAV